MPEIILRSKAELPLKERHACINMLYKDHKKNGPAHKRRYAKF